MVLIITLSKPVKPVQKMTEEKAIPQSSPIPEPLPEFVLVGETLAELKEKNRLRSRHRRNV
jgi:hypothetical protein